MSYRALIVDDDSMIQELMAESLYQEDFRCSFASDAARALGRLAHTDFDLIVTDLCMPHRHGHSLVMELLEREACPPIIVLTGITEPRLMRDLLHRGVADVLFKPVDFKVFAVKAHSVTAKFALQRQRQASMPDAD